MSCNHISFHFLFYFIQIFNFPSSYNKLVSIFFFLALYILFFSFFFFLPLLFILSPLTFPHPFIHTSLSITSYVYIHTVSLSHSITPLFHFSLFPSPSLSLSLIFLSPHSPHLTSPTVLPRPRGDV